MPFYFNVDRKLDLLYVAVAGHVTMGQLARHVEAYVAEPAFRADIDTLFDVPADAQIELDDNAAVDALVEAVRAARGAHRYRMACVVRSQEHETFFQAAMAIMSPEAEARAFYDRSEALGWLGHARTKAHRLRQVRARLLSPRRADEAAAA